MSTLKCVTLSLAVLPFAASANAAMTTIYRTDNNGGTATYVYSFSSFSDMGANLQTGYSALNPTIANIRNTYIFGDFTQGQTTQGYIYRTVLNGGSITQIIRYEALASDPLANLRSNTGGQVFNLQNGSGGGAAWSGEDDFYHDGTYFYRNASPGSGSNGATRYASFADLVANTNGTFLSFNTTFGYNDRFFGFEGKIYRTNTGGSGGSVTSIAVYNSFADLRTNTAVQSITQNVNWSNGDLFIAAPAPGALALLGLAGLAGSRRRR